MSIAKTWRKMKTKVLVITGIIILTAGSYSFVDNDFKLLKSLDIYYTLFRELNMFYVDETDPEKLVKASIDGMLESLDPYTVFIPESELDDFKFMTTGEYGGIGAMIKKLGPQVIISDLVENYPAHAAGIKIGDILCEINGKPVSQKSTTEISEMLKGEPQSEIVLTLERSNNPKPFKKTLERQKIVINNVPYYGIVNAKYGYIKISNFTTDAHIEVKNALINLKNQGAKGIILDLRGNPGGLLIEAVEIANLFVDRGQEIVRTKGKVKQWDNTYKTHNAPVDTEIPLTILVNRNSASASEIVAGSLQDLDRAVIIGHKTFGKGLVQTTRQLSYNTKLKVTTAKYYIPSGRCIQALDYSHRDADGSVGSIPDTLIQEFSTKVGRKVYDGGGIQPDITMKSDPISRITLNLYTRNYLFNYATLYMLKHDSIDLPSNFRFTNEDFDDFTAFLKTSEFDYQTETEEALIKLKNAAMKEKYWEMSKSEYAALEEKVKHDKCIDLQINKKEICGLLKEEIISRYYYQKGRIETSLESDEYVLQALDVFTNPTLYTGILNGTYKPFYADSRKRDGIPMN
jgi:carboxyl-terminal processing protease